VTSASPIVPASVSHVPGVGDQGDGGGDDADNDLHQHEPHQKRKSDYQVAPVGVGSRKVAPRRVCMIYSVPLYQMLSDRLNSNNPAIVAVSPANPNTPSSGTPPEVSTRLSAWTSSLASERSLLCPQPLTLKPRSA
jgi:hypothetical protein